jgi:hypothetical protein
MSGGAACKYKTPSILDSGHDLDVITGEKLGNSFSHSDNLAKTALTF